MLECGYFLTIYSRIRSEKIRILAYFYAVFEECIYSLTWNLTVTSLNIKVPWIQSKFLDSSLYTVHMNKITKVISLDDNYEMLIEKNLN